MSERRIPEALVPALEMICGCGNPEDVWSLYFDCLQKISQNQRCIPKTPDGDLVASGRALLPAYILDHLGWTEHGSSVYGCWLTADGKEVLAFLEEHGPTWLDGGEPFQWYAVGKSGVRTYY